MMQNRARQIGKDRQGTAGTARQARHDRQGTTGKARQARQARQTHSKRSTDGSSTSPPFPSAPDGTATSPAKETPLCCNFTHVCFLSRACLVQRSCFMKQRNWRKREACSFRLHLRDLPGQLQGVRWILRLQWRPHAADLTYSKHTGAHAIHVTQMTQ
jgi:hypothetical protein